MAKQLTPEQRRDILNRALATDPHGRWVEPYADLAAEYGVSRPCISQLTRKAGIPPRKAEGPRRRRDVVTGKRQPRFAVPPSLADLYAMLCKKLGNSRDARLVLQDHIRIRGARVSPRHGIRTPAP